MGNQSLSEGKKKRGKRTLSTLSRAKRGEGTEKERGEARDGEGGNGEHKREGACWPFTVGSKEGRESAPSSRLLGRERREQTYAVLCPLVLLLDLSLLLGGEVVDNVEAIASANAVSSVARTAAELDLERQTTKDLQLANLLGLLALDHVGNGLASDVAVDREAGSGSASETSDAEREDLERTGGA